MGAESVPKIEITSLIVPKIEKKIHEKALLVIITHFSTRERLCECIGIYRHVVVNIVLFFATCMYTVVGTRCTVYASTKDQSNGTQRINIQGQNVCTAKD